MSLAGSKVVPPRLRILLQILLVAFAVLVLDSVYLATVTLLEWWQGVTLQGPFYQSVFLVHLALGFLIVIPTLIYAGVHMKLALARPNRLAVKLGLVLFVVILVLLLSGILLTRGLPGLEVKNPMLRDSLYWAHVITPLAVGWLYVLHRLAGPRIRWRSGITLFGIGSGLAVGLTVLTVPVEAPTPAGDFLPSLARTSTGDVIDAEALMRDDYCRECHTDIHDQWAVSAHRFASFNNPAYRFSVRNTRQAALERDGDVRAARFCAGCHDPVPLFSGAFDDPDFDDVGHPTAAAGITCTACHAIGAIGSVRGNADYIITEPAHYPFAFAESPLLQWVNGILVKGKPALHKRTFLKPLHKSPEFCGTCHKVHLPVELNAYRWLRGQNHYDSFLLSGVSGHGITSFYYPPEATKSCNDCHMPLVASSDFGAFSDPDTGTVAVHDHQFPAANTALAAMMGLPDEINEAHRAMLEGALRVDIFGIRDGEDVDAPLLAPIGGDRTPTLEPGRAYLISVVLRTLTLGHAFTEGTADSNEVWLEVVATADGERIGASGQLGEGKAVDPWSHFVNAYVIDRYGNRIDRRNPEDIFTKLYDHQIPPGGADVVHYRLEVPETADDVTLEVALNYRKFDTAYFRLFEGDPEAVNELPIVTIARDTVSLPVAHNAAVARESEIPEWQRWNDFGIAMLAKPRRSGLRQAELAFREVIALGRPEGHLNLARVFLEEGRVNEAADALSLAAKGGALPWSVEYFSALVDLQNGEFDAAIERLRALVETRFNDARERGFDFSRDYRLLNRLAQALFQRAKLANGNDAARWLQLSEARFKQALALDPENVSAHYGLGLVYERLGDTAAASHHRALHEKYRPDDNAHDEAISLARQRDPAADHAARPLAIYDLHRTRRDE